jgi:serine/threonine protein kinase
MGKFGEVYLAQHESSGFLVALKKIVKKKIEEYKMTEQLKDEIRLHNSLDHPNIVKFYGFFEDNDIVYLILEYIPGGTLFDKLTECDRLSVK